MSLRNIAGQIGEGPYSVQCPDCDELVILSTLNDSASSSSLHFQHKNHNPRSDLPPPSSTAKEVCPHPQCSDIPFPHDCHVLVMSLNLTSEIDERMRTFFPRDIKKPSRPELEKFLRISNRCPKGHVPEAWMKNMLNYYLYTHPRIKTFFASTSLKEKLSLADQCKYFMDS